MSFQVRIEPHARTLSVRADQNVLDAALGAGMNLPHSCKSGHCGSCRARLIEGRISYPRGRPLGLTEQEALQGRILLCQARALTNLVVEARLIARVGEVAIKTLPCRIAGKRLLAPDVMQLMLRLPAVEHFEFQPGQYLDVLLEGDRRRSFSIASPPHDSELLELHVRRVPGAGFTEQLFSALPEGSLLRIEGPIGQFVYEPGDGPIVMIAGGTGFAPLKSMLRHALEHGATREIHLFWGGRQAIDIYEDQLLLTLVGRHPNLHYTAVLSEAGSAVQPHHRLGWVHEVAAAAVPDIARCAVYVAGPPALIEAAKIEFAERGVSAESLRFDSFDYAPR
jgi:CDP-4-dehydro-6-deoxyglucose reductase